MLYTYYAERQNLKKETHRETGKNVRILRRRTIELD